MIRFRILTILIVFLSPLSFVEASLRINEIAWQGYLGDANNEWIELYNDGEAVNLDGWLLEAEDGTPSINLSGLSVSSGDFILLERTDDSTVPGITADKFYSGALGNDPGEVLVLKNADGQEIDTVDALDWGGMESTSTGTYSWINGTWKEGVATPKASNEASENEEDDEEENEDDEDTDNEEETSSTSSTSVTAEKKTVTYKDRKATIEAEKYAFVGVPFSFTSYLRDLDGDEIRKGFYAWNMGDGTMYYKGRKGEFTHVYQHPGEYIVSLSYNRATFGQEPDELDPLIYDEHIVTVSGEALAIESFVDGALTVKNNSKHTMNIEDWVITNNDVRFTIPQNTMVRAGKTLTFPESLTKLEHNPIFIINPTGSVVDYTGKQEESTGSQEEGIVAGAQTSYEEEVEETELSFTEEEVFYLEHDEEEVLAPQKESSSWFTILFILLLVLSGAVLWIMMSQRKKETHVDGYEIVED